MRIKSTRWSNADYWITQGWQNPLADDPDGELDPFEDEPIHLGAALDRALDGLPPYGTNGRGRG